MHSVSIVLFALLAAIGYWVLQHAAGNKEAEVYVKRTGQTVGWALLVISLLGVAFSVAAPRGRFGGRCGDRMENRGGQQGNMGPGAMMGQPGQNGPAMGQPGMPQGGQPQAMRGGDRQEGPAMRGEHPGSEENGGRDMKDAKGGKPEAPKKN